MDRTEFKKELERHKTQIDASIKYLQKGFADLNQRNYEFCEFIESNSSDPDECLMKLERKVQDFD